MPEELRTIGKSVFRKEGIPKVTGQAAYVDDLRFENCLYGRTVRSATPHGVIKQIRFGPGIQSLTPSNHTLRVTRSNTSPSRLRSSLIPTKRR